MAKRRFRIEGGPRGGEIVLGTVSPEFVEYYKDADYDDLVEAVTDADDSYDDEPDDALLDPNAPPLPKEDFVMWECDDIEHINSAYSDGGFNVTEVPADGSNDWDWVDPDKQILSNYDPVMLGSREAAIFGKELPENGLEKDADGNQYVPVLLFHSGEKGGFGAWFVETDGEDFDQYKLTFTNAETMEGDFIQDVYYDKEMLDCDYDNNDTTGKGYYAQVGYLNTKWHDSEDSQYQDMENCWEDFDENVKYEKEKAQDTET